MVMKSIVFWDITLCIPLKGNPCTEEHVNSIFRVKEEAEQEISLISGGKVS
jgi:hypothetical protein